MSILKYMISFSFSFIIHICVYVIEIFHCFTKHTFILVSLKRMASNEISTIRQRFLTEQFANIRSTGGNKHPVQKQPPLRSSAMFPPIVKSHASVVSTTNNLLESPKSSLINYPAARYSFAQSNAPSLISRSSFLQAANPYAPPRRSTRYDHIASKIDTGLPRLENLIRTDQNTSQLRPSQKVNWSFLKQELEEDLQIRAQAKRLQYNSGVTYTAQITTLSDLVRSRVKSHLATIMSVGEERYKIIVQLHVFQTGVSGLHIGSRCLWNTDTDNSITFKMQGLDCDLLFVIFLCYTDLGACLT